MFQGRVCPVETLDERSPQDGQRYTALVQENKGEGDWDVGWTRLRSVVVCLQQHFWNAWMLVLAKTWKHEPMNQPEKTNISYFALQSPEESFKTNIIQKTLPIVWSTWLFYSRWWFQILFIFTMGFHDPIWRAYFQWGWNHQLQHIIIYTYYISMHFEYNDSLRWTGNHQLALVVLCMNPAQPPTSGDQPQAMWQCNTSRTRQKRRFGSCEISIGQISQDSLPLVGGWKIYYDLLLPVKCSGCFFWDGLGVVFCLGG